MSFSAIITPQMVTIDYRVNALKIKLNPSLAILATIVNGRYVKLTPTLPIVLASIRPSNAYKASLVSQKPVIVFTESFTNQYKFVYNIKQPSIIFNTSITNGYTISFVTQKPTLITGFSQPASGLVFIQTKIPIIHFTSVLTGTPVITTWALNTNTGAHSRYSNYAFSSFFKIGTQDYGVNDDGNIYALQGTIDFAGTAQASQINAQVLLPITDFDTPYNKVVSDIFLYARASDDFKVDVILDEEELFSVVSTSYDGTNGVKRRRVPIPKGLSGNAWQFRINNFNGSTFDIMSMDVLVGQTKRMQ